MLLELEEYIEKSYKELESDFEKDRAEIASDDDAGLDYLVDLYQDRKFELMDVYPTLHRSSLMVTFYSLIEKELFKVCDVLKNREGISKFARKISYPDNPPLIVKAQRYITNNCGIDFPVDSHEWKQINDGYREIRNVFVHDGGQVRSGKLDEFTQLEKFVPYYRVDKDHKELILEKRVLFEVH